MKAAWPAIHFVLGVLVIFACGWFTGWFASKNQNAERNAELGRERLRQLHYDAHQEPEAIMPLPIRTHDGRIQ